MGIIFNMRWSRYNLLWKQIRQFLGAHFQALLSLSLLCFVFVFIPSVSAWEQMRMVRQSKQFCWAFGTGARAVLWSSSSDVLYSFQRLAELNLTQSQLLPCCLSILSLHMSLLRNWPLAGPFGIRLSKVPWEKSDQVKVLEMLCLMSPSGAVASSVLSLILTLDLSLVLSGPWISSRPWADWQRTQRKPLVNHTHHLALEANSLAGVLPIGITQKDLEKLKKGSLPPASPAAAAGCSAAAQAAGSKSAGAGDKEGRLQGWFTWLRSMESCMQSCYGLLVKTGLGSRGVRLPCDLGAHLLAWQCCWQPGWCWPQGTWPWHLPTLGSGGTSKSCCRSTEQMKNSPFPSVTSKCDTPWCPGWGLCIHRPKTKSLHWQAEIPIFFLLSQSFPGDWLSLMAWAIIATA